MIKAIVFDWSGTLCNDRASVLKAINKVLKNDCGLKPLALSEFREKFDLPWSAVVHQFNIPDNWPKFRQKFYLYLKKGPKPKPYPGVIFVIRKLKEKGVKMALLSSKKHRFILRELKQFGILDCFDFIISNALNKREKIEFVIKKLNVPKSQIVFVGDLPHDVRTARAVGIKAVAATYGYSNRERLIKAKPDFVLNRFVNIKNIVSL